MNTGTPALALGPDEAVEGQGALQGETPLLIDWLADLKRRALRGTQCAVIGRWL